MQPDRVKLVLPMVSLIPAEVEQALRVRVGDRFAKLDKTAVQAVVTAQVEGSVAVCAISTRANGLFLLLLRL